MRWLLTIVSLLLLAACSTPRYAYYFPQPPDVVNKPGAVTLTPLTPPAESSGLQAGTVVTPETRPPQGSARAAAKTTTIRSVPADERPPAMAEDYPAASVIKENPELKRSAIFTAAGLVALIIGGNVFWVVGSLCLMIGLIFAIKWLLRK
jgi:uncharacterized membrane protein